MKKYFSITHRSKNPCVVALGCFDGVHLGHAEVVKQARLTADKLGVQCVVWTFDEPPKNYFLKSPVPLISNQKEKSELLGKLGADVLVSVPFIKETAELTPEDFFSVILMKRLNAVHIVCGFDYSFGAGGRGNAELLRSMCNEAGVGISVVPSINVDGESVSSSAIRSALENGDPEKATRLLGRPYSLSSVVIGGQHLARHLGFPTLNQEFPAKLTVPARGVYVTRIRIGKQRKSYYGISNVGVRPTVGGTSLFAETHIFDFTGDLYGQAVKVEFLKFLRSEKKFSDLEELKEQVNHDIDAARRYIENR